MEPKIAVVMGSDSDFEVMSETVKVFKDYGVPYEISVRSAHRTPEETAAYAKAAESRGIKVLIAGAGAAAHLAGVLASKTTIPVIGVPLHATPLGGLDALLATVQMPAGIPVATMAIGKAGARNAALFAVQILGTAAPELAGKLKDARVKMAAAVEAKSKKVQEAAKNL